LVVVRVELNVNGQAHALDVEPGTRLSSLLRDELGLTGTKVVCGGGACGACAVFLDDVAVNSCLVMAGMAHGRSVVTIEGLGDGDLTKLQHAFIDEDALQCGFCTPGQIVSATALLAANPHPTRAEIRRGMSGNLCRCGAYPRIEQAILRAAAS
jgi:aerobic-type carbon monoxide dehydrogenase small subunit (CoxS/CutS family)